VVRAALTAESPVDVLQSLDTGGNRRAVILQNGQWYSRSTDTGISETIPNSLQQLVMSGRPGSQRVSTPTGPAIVLGIPIENDTSYYVIDSLHELDRTLSVLALVLGLVAAVTTIAGAALGRYATRRVLHPLTVVVSAARNIARGDFDARLDPAAEPELATLTSSFNEMVGQLALRIERDRHFAADVSHELRSPLQTLAAAASVLRRREAQLDTRTAAAARLVTDEVDRFQRLVTDLLELSKGDQPAECQPVDIAELARSVCTQRGDDPAIVRIEGGTNPIWDVDSRRIGQALTNLLDNADRYGGGAKAVTIGQFGHVRYLEIDDEGPGIKPQDRVTVFNRFERGHAANARANGDGTGLGLALVAQHVNAHGGRVFVTDRPGGGARLRIEIGFRS
jgi:signal transduction histidine kinase